nr:hypothetical protein [Nocardioides sp. S-1144]
MVLRRRADPADDGQVGQQAALQHLGVAALELVEPGVLDQDADAAAEVGGHLDVVAGELRAVGGATQDQHLGRGATTGQRHQDGGAHRERRAGGEVVLVGDVVAAGVAALGGVEVGEQAPAVGAHEDVDRGPGDERGGQAVGHVAEVTDELLGAVLGGEDAEVVGAARPEDQGEVGDPRDEQVDQPAVGVGDVGGADQAAAGVDEQLEPLLGGLGRRPGPALGEQRGVAGAVGLDPPGHVGLDADEVGERALGAVDRADVHLVPVRRAVLAVVQHGARDVLAGTDGPADAVDVGRVGAGALEEPAVATDRLLQRVAGGGGEGGVHPDQGQVGVGRVGEGEGQPGGHHRARVQVEARRRRHLLAPSDRQHHDQRVGLEHRRVEHRQRDHPERLALLTHVAAAEGRDRLAVHRLGAGQARQRVGSLGEQTALEVAQPGRVGPDVERARELQPGCELAGDGVCVHDVAGAQVHQEDGGRLVAHEVAELVEGALQVGGERLVGAAGRRCDGGSTPQAG